MSASIDIDTIKISSWAAPTAEDEAILEGLTDEQYRALLRREIRKGFDSGISSKTMDDVWQEALRKVKATARASDAL
jgi:hypothetical protein